MATMLEPHLLQHLEDPGPRDAARRADHVERHADVLLHRASRQ